MYLGPLIQICYKKANVYIQASSYEGLPHVILEAISHNLSIISTPIGGSNEILMDGKNGWVWELKNNFIPEKNELVEIINKIVPIIPPIQGLVFWDSDGHKIEKNIYSCVFFQPWQYIC